MDTCAKLPIKDTVDVSRGKLRVVSKQLVDGLLNLGKACSGISNWRTSLILRNIPMKNGFVYLYAVIDVYSRFIVDWRLSNTLSDNNCYELIEDYVRMWGTPEIINSDQGFQYTTKKWEELLSVMA